MLVCCKERARYVHYHHAGVWSLIHLVHVLKAFVGGVGVGSSVVSSVGATKKPDSLLLAVAELGEGSPATKHEGVELTHDFIHSSPLRSSHT